MDGEATAVDHLFGLPRFGAGVGLHRMQALCAALQDGAWNRGLDAIKVTGSSGKGSVAVMVAAILRAAGVRVGCYTSPHLLCFAERIVIDGEPVEGAALDAAVAWLRQVMARWVAAHPDDTVGAFEAITAVAYHCFAAAQPETVVLEAGIGGRYDPTRIVPGRIAALITVELEHTALLGERHELIAYDKADLAPAGGTLVVGALPPSLGPRLAAYCALREVTLITASEVCAVRAARPVTGGMEADFVLAGRWLADVRVGLCGAHQVANAALAIVLARQWLAHHRPGLDPDALEQAVRAGLATLPLRGRCEQVRSSPPVWVDVGHTPAALATLGDALAPRLAGRPLLLVAGCSTGRDGAALFAPLLDACAAVICTTPRHRGTPATDLARLLRDSRPGLPVDTAPRVEAALAMALPRAAEEGCAVLVAGGLFLAAEALAVLAGEDPDALRFL